MLPSYSLSSGPYSTIYSISVQCNAGTFYSLFVWYCKSLNEDILQQENGTSEKSEMVTCEDTTEVARNMWIWSIWSTP